MRFREAFAAFCLLLAAFCLLHFHINQILGLERLQETHNLIVLELPITCFDHQKEPVRSQRKIGSVECRMIGLRQHSEPACQRPPQMPPAERCIQSDRDKGRPAVIRFSTDVKG